MADIDAVELHHRPGAKTRHRTFERGLEIFVLLAVLRAREPEQGHHHAQHADQDEPADCDVICLCFHRLEPSHEASAARPRTPEKYSCIHGSGSFLSSSIVPTLIFLLTSTAMRSVVARSVSRSCVTMNTVRLRLF